MRSNPLNISMGVDVDATGVHHQTLISNCSQMLDRLLGNTSNIQKKIVETLAFSVEKRECIIKLQQNFKFDVFWNINKCDFTLSSPYTNSYNNQLKMFHTDMI